MMTVTLPRCMDDWQTCLDRLDPIVSTVFSLLAILISITLLGWPMALRATTATMPRAIRARERHHPRTRQRGELPADLAASPPFVYVPVTIVPALLLLAMLLPSEALLLTGIFSGSVLLIMCSPLLALGMRMLALATARWWYARTLRSQLLPALQRMVATTGGYTTLLDAWRTITPTLPPPLRSEWQWVLDHLNQPYSVPCVDGGHEQRFSTMPMLLRRLADQTPVDLHARVLEHLAAIYDDGLEHHAHTALTRIAAALARQTTLQRAVATQLGRIRGEAAVITVAFGGIALWLGWSQTERIATAFLGSPWGFVALGWFAFWLALPLIVGTLVTRIPDLPL